MMPYSRSFCAVRHHCYVQLFHAFPLTESGVQLPFADSQAFGCNLQQLVLVNEFQSFLERKYFGRSQGQGFISLVGAGVGQMFGFADVQFNVFGFTVLADDHPSVYPFAGAYEQSAALLGGK